jgi:hypothetical protein
MGSEPLEKTKTGIVRHQWHRRVFRGKLEVERGSSILDGTVQDIGPRGLFVELTPPLWVGESFHAKLILNPVLMLDCTVVRVEPEIGMAVTFKVLEAKDNGQLQSLLVGLHLA